MITAPIALFVYNRPKHTRQTVEALQKNELAGESELFIYSDAPKKPEAVATVREVRDYIRTITGFRSINIIERDRNWGLANSIIDGITNLCNKYGRVIVLEDDLVTSSYFLRYMNDALDMYEHDEKVMHISGCKYPIKEFGGDNTFFFRVPLCWGWATWQLAWQHFSKDISVIDKFDRQMISDFSFDGNYHYWKQLQLNKSGKLNTWFVFWYATLFLRGGLALFPQTALVRNVGMDGSGVHCGKSDEFNVELCAEPIRLTIMPAVENQEAVQLHKMYFRGAYRSSSSFALVMSSMRKAVWKILKGAKFKW